MNQYETKVRYRKIDNNGKEVTAKETYLVSGVNFGDAETNIHKEMESLISGDFDVTNINRVNYSDILQHPGEKWYKGKVQFIAIEEGKEKKATHLMLIPADNVDEATERIKIALKTLIVDFEIVSIAESPIVDVFL